MPFCMHTVTITVLINNNNNTATVGEGFTLTCVVSGVSSLHNPDYKYIWMKDGNLLNDKTSTLQFNPLTLDDLGIYQCQVIVTFDRVTRNYTSQQFPLTKPGKLHKYYISKGASTN